MGDLSQANCLYLCIVCIAGLVLLPAAIFLSSPYGWKFLSKIYTQRESMYELFMKAEINKWTFILPFSLFYFRKRSKCPTRYGTSGWGDASAAWCSRARTWQQVVQQVETCRVWGRPLTGPSPSTSGCHRWGRPGVKIPEVCLVSQSWLTTQGSPIWRGTVGETGLVTKSILF